MSAEPVLEKVIRHGATVLCNSATPMLDARILMKHVLRYDDAAMVACGRQPVGKDVLAVFRRLIGRRRMSEPVAYITGEREFWSLSFRVSPQVLIPRPETECLVQEAVKRRRSVKTILDLGTGSGCILCALLHEFEDACGTGIDRYAGALEIARFNAFRHGMRERSVFVAGDWGKAVRGKFDIIVSNPPYIPSGGRDGLAGEIRDFEPATALFAGHDGLEAYRELIRDLSRLLAPGGLVLLETGENQADAVKRMLENSLPDARVDMIPDMAGHIRGIAADCAL